MVKKKGFLPEDYEDLKKIFSGEDYDRLRKYSDWMNSTILSDQRENLLRMSVNQKYKVKKIKEIKGIRTPDHIIETEKLYLEVTSINAPVTITRRYQSPDIPRKINEAIAHTEEKDKLGRDDFDIGCLVFVDLQTTLFEKMLQKDKLIKYVKKSIFLESDVSFLLFRPVGAIVKPLFGEPKNTNSLYPPIAFVKNEETKQKICRVFTAYPQPEVIVISKEKEQIFKKN